MSELQRLKKVGWALVDDECVHFYRVNREKNGEWPAIAVQSIAVTGQVNAQIKHEEVAQVQALALSASNEYLEMIMAENGGFVALFLAIALLGLPGAWALLGVPGFVVGFLYLREGRKHYRCARELMDEVLDFEGKGPRYAIPGESDERMCLMVGVPLDEEE